MARKKKRGRKTKVPARYSKLVRVKPYMKGHEKRKWKNLGLDYVKKSKRTRKSTEATWKGDAKGSRI